MELTAYEQNMLDGVYGVGCRTAMKVLVKMGELYGAKRFLPIKNAHIDAAAYTTIWDAGTEFVEYLAYTEAKVSVPTTINPISRDIRRWKELGISANLAEKSRRLEEAYLKMGVIPTWTCAPYQCTNVPQFGEVVGWSESNAVNFINSVVGARAERLPDLVDVCCAVAGRVPAYGLYLDENRAGQMIFRLEGFDGEWFRDSVDYALLGYYIGEIAVSKVPVITGLPESTMPDQLKALSAAGASSGAMGMFHAVGLTPEAPTLSAAVRGRTDLPEYLVTPKDLALLRARLNTAREDRVDMVLMGCPHLSFTEISEIADLIRGRKVREGVTFRLMTNETQYALAKRTEAAEVLEQAGVSISCDTCLMEMEEDRRWAGMNLVTNSGKAAQYAPGINGVNIFTASVAGCVEAAVTGKFPAEKRYEEQLHPEG